MMPQGVMGYGGMTTGGGFYQPTMPGYGGMMVSIKIFTLIRSVYAYVHLCVCVCVRARIFLDR